MKNTLSIGGVSAEELSEEYGTPLYIYDGNTIRERVSSLRRSITYPKTKVYYACKANSNPEIIKLLMESGIDGIDAVSFGEARLAMSLGFEPWQVSLTNPSLSEEQIREIHKQGIELKVDSISQLKKWAELSDEAWLRINPGIGFGYHQHVITGGAESKFGISLDEIEQVKGLIGKVIGLHQHSGSGVLNVEDFLKTLEPLYKTTKTFPELEGINIGGGLGIPYNPGESRLDVERFGKKLSEGFSRFVKSYGRNLTLCLEPGRYFVGEAGMLLTRVNSVKERQERKFVLVDTGFNHLVRPILYGAYHKTENVTNPHREKETVRIEGNVCESGDLLAKDREISRVEEGDLIAFYNTGAYGYSMASHYTGQDLPAEVMVSNGSHRLIRARDPFVKN